MRAWKIVDADHAHFVERGSLRIGTLQGYKDLENGRADEIDGAVDIRADALFYEVPEHRRAMERIGMVGGVVMGCRVIVRPPPLYAFCMTQPGCRYDPQPGKPKVVFRIKHLHRLGRLISETYPDRISGYLIRHVTYDRRHVDALEEHYGAPDPFMKDQVFSSEKEIRIIWLPRSNEEISSFITEPDPRIATYISRVSEHDTY
jgi:hypothetical protein